jgi:hypothetical protein
MNKGDPQLSVSFDILRKEIQERGKLLIDSEFMIYEDVHMYVDEVIGMLRKKLQVMESFHCSSSSLDALNKHQPSSIFVLPEATCFSPDSVAEASEFPSPKMKSFGLISETPGKRTRCYTDTNTISLEPSPTLRMRRASLFDHVQRLRIPSFLKAKQEELPALPTPPKKSGIFKRLLSRIKSKFSRRNNTSQALSGHMSSKASIASQIQEEHTELTYEQIISGQFQLPLDKVEVKQSYF